MSFRRLNDAAGRVPVAMREFANRLCQETVRSDASVRILEGLTPYAKTTIWNKLTGKSKVDWDFVEAILLACAYLTRRAPDLEIWRREFDRMAVKVGYERDAVYLDGRVSPQDIERRLAVARSLYLGGEEVREDDVPGAEITIASWLRCDRESAHLGVDFVGDPDLDTPLIRYGQPVVNHRLASWGAPPVCAILASPDVVICTQKTTDVGLQRELRLHNLAPGFRYDERNAFTNGLGTAMAVRGTAYIAGPAHLAEELQNDACAASIVKDPWTNAVAGVFNLTCRRDDAHPYLAEVAKSIADSITIAMMADRLGR